MNRFTPSAKVKQTPIEVSFPFELNVVEHFDDVEVSETKPSKQSPTRSSFPIVPSLPKEKLLPSETWMEKWKVDENVKEEEKGKQDDCRFTIEGELSTDIDDITMNDIISLIRSPMASQRSVHLVLLNKIIVNDLQSKHKLEGKIISIIDLLINKYNILVVLRMSLDDQNITVLTNAITTLFNLITPYTQFNFNWNEFYKLTYFGTQLVPSSTLSFNTENQSGEQSNSVNNNNNVDDVIETLLEMEILNRIRYILEVIEIKNVDVKLIEIITIIALHSSSSSLKRSKFDSDDNTSFKILHLFSVLMRSGSVNFNLLLNNFDFLFFFTSQFVDFVGDIGVSNFNNNNNDNMSSIYLIVIIQCLDYIVKCNCDLTSVYEQLINSIQKLMTIQINFKDSNSTNVTNVLISLITNLLPTIIKSKLIHFINNLIDCILNWVNQFNNIDLSTSTNFEQLMFYSKLCLLLNTLYPVASDLNIINVNLVINELFHNSNNIMKIIIDNWTHPIADLQENKIIIKQLPIDISYCINQASYSIYFESIKCTNVLLCLFPLLITINSSDSISLDVKLQCKTHIKHIYGKFIKLTSSTTELLANQHLLLKYFYRSFQLLQWTLIESFDMLIDTFDSSLFNLKFFYDVAVGVVPTLIYQDFNYLIKLMKQWIFNDKKLKLILTKSDQNQLSETCSILLRFYNRFVHLDDINNTNSLLTTISFDDSVIDINSYGDFIILNNSCLPLSIDWYFLPFTLFVNKNNQSKQLLKVIESCLDFIYYLETLDLAYIECIDSALKLDKLIQLLFINNEFYLEKTCTDKFEVIMQILISKNITKESLQLFLPVSTLVNITQQYQASSYGNSTIGKLFHLFIQMKFPIEYRSTVWKELNDMLNNLNESPFADNVDGYLYPLESNFDLLQIYADTLVSEKLIKSRNYLLYYVAIHHLHNFLFSDNNSIWHKQLLLSTLNQSPPEVLRDLINYKYVTNKFPHSESTIDEAIQTERSQYLESIK